MKLYHATTVYQFLNVVAHMQKSKSFGKDIVLFSHWMRTKFADLKPLEKFFKKIYYYDASLFNVTEGKLLEAIDNNINSFLNKNKIKLSEFEEIVVGGVQYNFGIYLCNNKIPFSVVEESCGIYSHPEVIFNIDCNIPTVGERAQVAKELNIYDCSNEAIKKVYCDFNALAEGFESEKACDFRVLEILKTLDKETLDLFLSIFGINSKIQLNEDAVLLLTQQFANLNILDFKNHILIYQLFSDFLLENKKIIIKRHPDDICYYSRLLKNASIIQGKFPSELSPFVFENIPKTIATISSTGVKPLRYLFDECISLDFEYEKNFKNTIKYYTAVEYLSRLGIENCKLIGVNVPLFSQLCNAKNMNIFQECVSNPESIGFSANTAVVIDTCSHSDDYINKLLSLNFDLYIFINSKRDYAFYRLALKEQFNHLFPVTIKKVKQREDDNYLDYKSETIFVYSTNKEIYTKMKDITIEKNLENTGAKLNVEKLTDEQLEIARLKGILAATEKRLLYYINKEKEEE